MEVVKKELTPEQQKLVADNRRLPRWYVLYYHRKYDGVVREELIGECMIAMCRSALTYNTNYRTADGEPVRFTTYATKNMRYACQAWFRTKMHKYGVRHASLDRGYGPGMKDMSGTDVFEVSTFDDDLEDDLPPVNYRGLRHLEKAVIDHYFGVNGAEVLNLAEIGKRYGRCRERMRQILGNALVKLAESNSHLANY